MKKQILILLVAVTTISGALWLNACQKEDANDTQATDLQVTDRAPADAKVFPRTAHPYGKSYEEWAEEWVRQFMSYGCDDVPWVHPENVLFYQSGPLYILAGIAEEGGTADITVPHGKALMFPLVNVWWDYPCPEEYGFEPPAGVPVEEWLLQLTSDNLDQVDESSLLVTIDGSSVSNVPSYKVLTDIFDFTGNTELTECFDPCVTGTSQPVASGGYYIILKPLSRGHHTVHYYMEASWGIQDATYHITVQ